MMNKIVSKKSLIQSADTVYIYIHQNSIYAKYGWIIDKELEDTARHWETVFSPSLKQQGYTSF